MKYIRSSYADFEFEFYCRLDRTIWKLRIAARYKDFHGFLVNVRKEKFWIAKNAEKIFRQSDFKHGLWSYKGINYEFK